MTIDFARILSLLSSMYLCTPARDAIEGWKTLLSENVPEFLRDLKGALGRVDLDSERELADLLWEYTRLFIGPYKLPCPPWESVYTSPQRLMMQSAYDEVQRVYHEAGLALNNPDIMHDHIGAELNFLAVVLQKIKSEPGKRLHYTTMAKRFLQEHLAQWIPQFTRDMEEAADSLLYKALAQVTRNVIAPDERRNDRSHFVESCWNAGGERRDAQRTLECFSKNP